MKDLIITEVYSLDQEDIHEHALKDERDYNKIIGTLEDAIVVTISGRAFVGGCSVSSDVFYGYVDGVGWGWVSS